MTTTPYDAAGGLAGLTALAHAWHERCLADPLASHPFGHPGQHPEHTARLAAYWAEALGGPALYSGAGEPPGTETHMRRLHAGNGEHAELDARCAELFDEALGDVGLAGSAVGDLLARRFREVTAVLAAYHASPDQVPDGLALPRWSRDA